MKFHHFGLAVFKFEPAVGFFKSLGYHCSQPLIDPLQNVELVLCTSDIQPWVELIRPVNEKSPVQNFLKKNQEMIYHCCYSVKLIDNKTVKNYFPGMKTLNISPPKPAILFENCRVAFYYVKGLGLIELLEKP